MFINFLVNLLDLYGDPVATNYAAWYETTGAILGAFIPAIISLVMVILFYYLFAKVKALTLLHWMLTSFVNILIVFTTVLFVGRAALANWVDTNLVAFDDSFQYIYDSVVFFPFTVDLWIFATNSIVWSLVFFFVWSVILKRWSIYNNIPFGSTNTKVKKR